MILQAMPKEVPERSPKYLKWVGTLPCAICGGKAQAHHQQEKGHGTMGGKCSDKRAVPLCASHHNGGGTHRHPGSFHGPARLSGWKFWEAYRINVEDLISRLNRIWGMMQEAKK